MKFIRWFLVAFVVIASCASTPKRPTTFQEVSASQVVSPAMAAGVEGQGVRLKAKFGHILPGIGIGGLEAYTKTHTMVMFIGEDGSNLPYVLVEGTDPVLPTLKSGDLVQIDGVPHNSMDIYEYVVVFAIKKI